MVAIHTGTNNNDSFIWNLTLPVGTGQPNKIDDVELVRLGYFWSMKVPAFNSAPGGQKLMSMITNLGTRGGFVPLLGEIIVEHEKVRGGTQDGKITPARGHITEYDANHSWIIVKLSKNISFVFPGIFPRLDLIENCGPELRIKILKIFSLPIKDS